MAQHLTDPDKRNVRLDHLARRRVPEAVRPTSAIPARLHARRTVEATVPDAIGSYGALDRRNTSRRLLRGRPRRR